MPLRDGLALQLNGYNLTDQKYYDLIHPGACRARRRPFAAGSLNFRL